MSQYKITTKRTSKNKKRSRRARTVFEVNQVENMPIQTRSFRFRGNNVTTLDFQGGELARFLGVCTSGTTNFYCLMSRARLLSLTITLLPDTIAYADLAFQWTNPNGPQTLHTMIGQIATPMRETFVPPKDTPCDFWYDPTDASTNLFKITSAGGCDMILDFNIQYMIADGGVLNATLNTASTVTGICARRLTSSPANMDAVGLNNVS